MKRAAIFICVGARSRAPWRTLESLHEDRTFQEDLLRDLIARRGWRLVRVYRDVVARPRGRRQRLGRMLAGARRGDFDVLVMWSFGHFNRASADPSAALVELRGRGVDVIAHRQGWDTTRGRGEMGMGVAAAAVIWKRHFRHERLFQKFAEGGERNPQREEWCGEVWGEWSRRAVIRLRRRGFTWRAIAIDHGVGLERLRRFFAGEPMEDAQRMGGRQGYLQSSAPARHTKPQLVVPGCWVILMDRPHRRNQRALQTPPLPRR